LTNAGNAISLEIRNLLPLNWANKAQVSLHVASFEHVLAHTLQQRLAVAAWVEASGPALYPEVLKQQRLQRSVARAL
jgi:hypothetical protein